MARPRVLIVGGGLAGMMAAIEAHEAGAEVTVLTRVYPVRSHSGAAQGGVNGALANHPDAADDTWQRHAYDTVKGSDYLADQDAAEFMTQRAPGVIIQLERWGCPFSRLDDGRIAQRPFGGAGFPRTCFAADRTGHVMLHTLFEQCTKRGIRFLSDWQLLALARDGDRIAGAVALDLPSGEVRGFAASAVVVATGGYGRVYARSTNAIINTGSGMGICYRAGVPLKDMEFVQFHPTTLIGTNILMTEACRGEGGRLRNVRGERFMGNYVSMDPPELAPRDIVARSIQREIDGGNGFPGGFVHLDLTHLGGPFIMERLPGIREICIQFAGIDPIDKPIPIQPGQHYSMGGIDTDVECRAAGLRGLFAAGEAACVSVHGANRLGGNSLLETVVFGQVAGRGAAEEAGSADGGPAREPLRMAVAEQEERIEALRASRGPELPADLRDELKQVMSDRVGIFRTAEDLRAAVERIAELRDRFPRVRLTSAGRRYNLDLSRTLELEHKLEIAEAIALGALERTESRGSHWRVDHPTRDDDNWLHHTLAVRAEDGSCRLARKPVTITSYAPAERTY